MSESLLERFIRYIREKELFTLSDRILLTVSGGVDSMVMMNLMVEAGYSVGVAHCNFQLRGDEAVEDEELVANHAARLGIPHYNKRFDTAGEMERTGESVQIAARRLRYEWFDELSRQHGYTVVAIAHQADDSIETFFINLFRGTPLLLQVLIINFGIFGNVRIDKVIIGVIACGLNSAAYVAEIVRGGIMSVEKGQTEAGRSLGMSRSMTMWKVAQ